MTERLPKLLKALRQEVHRVKLKSLMRLDRSDRQLLERKVEQLVNDVIRIQCIGEARCTVVLEMFEHMGGQIRRVS